MALDGCRSASLWLATVTPYFLLFAFFALGALLRPPLPPEAQRKGDALLLIGGLLILAMVGLRYHVGADWTSYERLFRVAEFRDLGAIIRLQDPGYMLVNWVAQQFGAGVWLVNLFCATIYAWGLIRFARSQPDPWLAVLIGIPYLTIVVAMGYTRQGVAIGFIMAGLAEYFSRRSLWRFFIYVGFAATFHRTAVLFLPLVIFTTRRNRVFNTLGGVAIAYVLYQNLLLSSSDTLIRNYVKNDYNSQGAYIRVAMDVFAALLFLLRPSAFNFTDEERALWRNCSILSLLFVGMLFVLPSTVTDRLALYIIPMQLAVLSRVPGVYLGVTAGRLAVMAYSLTVMTAWLSLTNYASAWVPYRIFIA